MTLDRSVAFAWARDGAEHLRGLMSRMGDDAFAAPSGVPDWSRGALLSHVARNADALVNLLRWARTGVPTPAYVSDDQRAQDIASGAMRTPAEIRADVVASSDRLASAVREMSGEAWSATVEMRGRSIVISEIAWVRAVETWVHAIDLDVGAEFTDLPQPMLYELIGVTAAALGSRPEHPDVVLVVDGEPSGRWGIGASPSAEEIHASAPDIASWLMGRSSGRRLRRADGRRLPELPAWR